MTVCVLIKIPAALKHRDFSVYRVIFKVFNLPQTLLPQNTSPSEKKKKVLLIKDKLPVAFNELPIINSTGYSQ